MCWLLIICNYKLLNWISRCLLTNRCVVALLGKRLLWVGCSTVWGSTIKQTGLCFRIMDAWRPLPVVLGHSLLVMVVLLLISTNDGFSHCATSIFVWAGQGHWGLASATWELTVCSTAAVIAAIGYAGSGASNLSTTLIRMKVIILVATISSHTFALAKGTTQSPVINTATTSWRTSFWLRLLSRIVLRHFCLML